MTSAVSRKHFLFLFACSAVLLPVDSLVTRRRAANWCKQTLSLSSENLPGKETCGSLDEVPAITSVLLRISYDGGRFTGWSAANKGDLDGNLKQRMPRLSKRQRRRGIAPKLPKGFVRPVEGILRDNLAKLYGNVDPERVVVEGSSRTDKGVHAQALMAQVYCLTQNAQDQLLDLSTTGDDNEEATREDIPAMENEGNRKLTKPIFFSIPGKRKPHPTSPTDNSFFEPSPMDGNMSRMAFALNRMLPADVRITGVAPAPNAKQKSGQQLPFHPSQNAVTKTYEYKISVGCIHDPTQWKFTWHIDNAPSGKLNFKAMTEACHLLRGKHNFAAFRGSPRGSDDKRRRNEQRQHEEKSVCTLSEVRICQVPSPMANVVANENNLAPSAKAIMSSPSSSHFRHLEPALQTYTITVTGDRFLYKMVRFLVGSIVAVGMGRLDLGDIEQALETGAWHGDNGANKDIDDGNEESRCKEPKRKEFQCAPSRGLVLRHVDYGFPIDWQPLWY